RERLPFATTESAKPFINCPSPNRSIRSSINRINRILRQSVSPRVRSRLQRLALLPKQSDPAVFPPNPDLVLCAACNRINRVPFQARQFNRLDPVVRKPEQSAIQRRKPSTLLMVN